MQTLCVCACVLACDRLFMSHDLRRPVASPITFIIVCSSLPKLKLKNEEKDPKKQKKLDKEEKDFRKKFKVCLN